MRILLIENIFNLSTVSRWIDHTSVTFLHIKLNFALKKWTKLSNELSQQKLHLNRLALTGINGDNYFFCSYFLLIYCTIYWKSQAVVAEKTVYVSGCLGTSLESGQLVSGAKGQAELALTHLKNVLRASGSSLNNVVKTTVYLQDFNDFSTVNEVYRDGMFPILTSYRTKNKTKSFPFFLKY